MVQTKEDRERLRIYRENNKDKISEKCRQYYQKHKEQIKKNVKQYNEKNKEQQKIKSKQYREDNKENILKQKKEYRENNKEKIKLYNKTDNFIKSNKISKWKRRGLIEDYNIIYEIFMGASHCDDCNVELTIDTKITSTTKCMDHCHTTGLYRGIVCHSCNLIRA